MRPSPPPTPTSLPRRTMLSGLALPALVVGGVLSLVVFLLARSLTEQQAQQALERSGGDRVAAVRSALEDHVAVLSDLRALWYASERVEPEEFRAFVLPLLERYPGLRALAWAPAVPPVELDRFQARARAEGRAGYEVHARDAQGRRLPPGPRAMHYPVLFAEPQGADALGLDLAGEDRLRFMVESAAAAGELRASARQPWTPGGADGLVAVLPVHPSGVPGRASGASARPEGVVAGAFDVEGMVVGALRSLAPEPLDVHLIVTEPGSESMHTLSLAAPTRAPGPEPELPGDAQDSPARMERVLELAGLRWQVVCVAAPGFLDARRRVFEWLLLAAGLVLTAALAVLLAARERRALEIELAHDELASSHREREQALAALRESEARFRLLFERHSSVMLLVDHESGTIVDANPAAEGFYGYAREELRRMRVADLNSLPPEEIQLLLDRAAEESRNYFVVPHRLASGEERKVEIYSSPIEYQGRRLLFSILHDVSDREAIQRRMLEAQKLESLGVLAGGIAHDFNNLLTGLTGNAELALQQLPSHSPARANLQHVLRAAERAATLTRRLLAYAGKGSYERRALDLSEQVGEVVALLRPGIPAGVALELDLAVGLPAVSGDRAQLQQVLMNLVLNAVEACEDERGRVQVRTSRADRLPRGLPVLSETGEPAPGPHVLLDVVDDGVGMDEATRARIFDPFFTTKFTGRGLGLAAVVGIVRAHRGRLKVDSRPGRGTRFRIWLPVAEASQSPPADAAAAQDAQSAPLLLLVDDDPSVREVTRALLASQGFEVDLAESGERALELVEERGDVYALVLLDATMPGLSGKETLRTLRARRPGMAVVVISGYDEAEAMRGLTDGGDGRPDGFLQKPYTPRALGQAVRAALERSGGAPETRQRG